MFLLFIITSLISEIPETHARTPRLLLIKPDRTWNEPLHGLPGSSLANLGSYISKLGHFSPSTCAVRNKSIKQPPVRSRRKFTHLSSLWTNRKGQKVKITRSYGRNLPINHIGKVCGSPFHGYTGLERRESLQAFHLRGLELSVQSLHLQRQRCNDARLGRPMVTWLYSLNLKSPDRGMIERNPEWTHTKLRSRLR